MTSKFRAKPTRTNHSRGFIINRKDIEKISKQYLAIEEIKILDSEGNQDDDVKIDKQVTEVTQVTDFKDAISSFPFSSDICSSSNNQDNNDDNKIDKDKHYETDKENADDNKKSGNNIQNIEPIPYYNNNENKIAEYTGNEKYQDPDQNSVHAYKPEDLEILPITPSNSVTCVTSVTITPTQYPCYFCGNNYRTHIDFDMGNHFIEKHKDQLYILPISGNRERKIDWIIAQTKRRLAENSSRGNVEDEDRRC